MRGLRDSGAYRPHLIEAIIPTTHRAAKGIFLRAHGNTAVLAYARSQFAIESILWRSIERNPSLPSKIMIFSDLGETKTPAWPTSMRIS